MKYFLALITWIVVFNIAYAQPAEFDFVESDLSAIFLGQAQVNGETSQEGDWIAAFDLNGNCVGANPIIYTSNTGLFSLKIYGDDATTPNVDEGLEDGELFIIKLYDVSNNAIISYPDNSDPVQFDGWQDLDGSPMLNYNDPDDIYNFIVFFNLGCSSLITPNNGAINVGNTTLLDWFDIPNTDGYKLLITDEENNFTNVDTIDVGSSNSYILDSLECATTYYVKIIPYNEIGEQTECLVESFSTIFNTADAGPNQVICQGESVQLNATGGTLFQWSPSYGLNDTITSSPIASPDTTTTYIVKATHSNGCVDYDTVVINVNNAPAINLTISHETTQGADNGAAFSSPSNGQSPYTFLWSTGDTGSSISDLIPDVYSLTVTDAFGCLSTESFEILAYNCIEFTVFSNITNVSCHDDCDGSIAILDIENATGPFTYVWSNGAITNGILDQCPGLYSVTISDVLNCTSIRSFIISNPEELNANVSSSAEQNPGGNDGIAVSSPIGGTAPFYYLWSNGNTTSLIDTLSPGIYGITVTDSNGCSDETLTIINQYGCEDLDFDATPVDISCAGGCDGNITIDIVDGGVEPYSYFWSTGSVNHKINDLCTGIYTVTITDDENCKTFGIYEISEPNELLYDLIYSGEMTEDGNDGEASIEAYGGTAPYFYQWSSGDIGPIAEDLSPGDYYVTIVDARNCNKIDSFTIDSFFCPVLIVTKTINQITCNGICDGTISIEPSEGTAPYTYLWSNGENTNNLIDLCPETYIVTISDSNGCQVIDTTMFTEDEPLEIEFDITSETGFLTGDGQILTTVIGGAQPYTYEWSNGETTPSVTHLIPGIYSMTLTDARGCQIIDNNLVINEFECSSISINYSIQDLICYDECIGSISITNISEGTFPFTYNWSSGESTNSIIEKCGGEYTVTITDANDCTVIETFTIQEPDAYFIAFDFLNEYGTGNNNGYIHATVIGGTPPYQFEWNTGSGSLNLNNIGGGIYTMIATDANGCITDKTMEILTIDCSVISLNSSTQNNSCFGTNDAYINISLDNATAPITINWSNGSTSPSLTQLGAGEYSVTVVDANNCTLTDIFVITSPEEIIISLDELQHSTDAQLLGSASISVAGGVTPYSYNWTGQNGFQSNNEDINNLEVGCYNLILTDANDCQKTLALCISDLTTATINIEDIAKKVLIFPNPVSDIAYIDMKSLDVKSFNGTIFDISGKEIHTFSSNKNYKYLDLSFMNNGLYFIELNINQSSIYKKIYIQK